MDITAKIGFLFRSAFSIIGTITTEKKIVSYSSKLTDYKWKTVDYTVLARKYGENKNHF